MSTGKIMTGIAFGAAIGSLLGALYAPEKGSKTRKQLSKKGTEYADELKNRFNDMLDGLKADLMESKESAEETMVLVKKAIKSPTNAPKVPRKQTIKKIASTTIADTLKKNSPKIPVV